MEQFSQLPKAPSMENQMSVEAQMKEAAKYINDAIKQLTDNEGMSGLAAARKVYEEVKGHHYRQEQVTAKLLELLAVRNELDMRTQEMARYSSGLASLDPGAQVVGAANDERYSTAA